MTGLVDDVGLTPLAGDIARVEQRLRDAVTADDRFLGDVAGHLVRDGETVMLRELTEGRKYSCLRLKARDVATVILGENKSAISYHVRFLRAPRALTRIPPR